MNLNKLFLNYCKKNNLEINPRQIILVEQLNKFYKLNFNKSFLKTLLSKKKSKLGFYLHGDVGVGKTMILNFFYENFEFAKQRLHFNEFMIGFHDFVFENKEKKEKPLRLTNQVKNLKTKIDNVPKDTEKIILQAEKYLKK